MASAIATQKDIREVLTLGVLRANQYPGRGIVIGLSDSGNEMIQVYWIMGRSKNSQNRIFSAENGRVFTEAADPAEMKDPSLIIYNAMEETPRTFIVSNGVQTDTIKRCVLGTNPFYGFVDGMWKHIYEPDSPNYTPRIAGICYYQGGKWFAMMGSTRKSLRSMSCEYHFHDYSPPLEKGVGFCLTTYSGDSRDGKPLPAFRGEPFSVPISGSIEDIASNFWNVLYEPNRVSLVVKSINMLSRESEVRIINRFQKVH